MREVEREVERGVEREVEPGVERDVVSDVASAMQATDTDTATDTPNTSDSIATSADAIAIHWARQKIKSLMDEQRTAVDNELHRTRITTLAMNVGLVSAYTSFVAVEERPSRPVNNPWQSTQVASLMPAGNLMEPVMLPAGAAGSDTLRFISLLFASLGGVLLCWAQRLGTRHAT